MPTTPTVPAETPATLRAAAPHLDGPGERLLSHWRRLAPIPGGRWLFHRILRRMVPYTGALGARVQHLERGDVAISLADRRAVRNHLRSIHAIALANLAEFASGTAMLTALDPGVRGIVVRFEMTYHKKARGVVTARARVDVPPVLEPMELHPEAEITDSLGDVVARARVTWRVEPRLSAVPGSQGHAARDATRARA